MIGNDVIDLALASRQSDWRREGFLEKLFSLREQEFIQMSANPHATVWDLWSRKEAAYKIFNRNTGIRAFNPLYFACADCNTESTVAFGESTVFTRTETTAHHIHTLAVASHSFFDSMRPAERSKLLKADGLPYYRESDNSYMATLSHHGEFVRCFFLKSDGLDFDLAGQGAMDGAFLGDFH